MSTVELCNIPIRDDHGVNRSGKSYQEWHYVRVAWRRKINLSPLFDSTLSKRIKFANLPIVVRMTRVSNSNWPFGERLTPQRKAQQK